LQQKYEQHERITLVSTKFHIITQRNAIDITRGEKEKSITSIDTE